MFGYLFAGLGHLLAWIWNVDPPVMTLLALAVLLGFGAVLAVPRGGRRTSYRREWWPPTMVVLSGDPRPDPVAEPLAEVIPLRRDAA